jgi:hypothetical protein
MYVTERTKMLDWLAHVGEDIHFECDVEVIRLASWQDAMTECASPEWKNTQIQAGNSTTQYLNRYHKEKFQKWNLYVNEAKQLLAPDFDRLDEYVWAHKLENVVSDSARWDVISAVVEEQYWQLGAPKFFLELFPIYELGHFPCGWRGTWPDGSLVIY